jgi:hypothetical protein
MTRQQCWEEAMKLKNIGYAVVIAATAVAFVIGSAIPSDAKAKKKKAEAAPTPLSCLLTADKPVCGSRGGMSFTYANSCYAAKDGAKVTAWKACSAKKAMKAHKKGGKKKATKPAKKKAMKKK